jgi:hypothetical protein
VISEGLISLKAHIAPKKSTGNKGGYISKLSRKFPSINNERDLCPPQAGQSIPNSLLYTQGSILIINEKP